MTQDNQRNLIKLLHEKYKVKYKDIAENIGISKSYLCMWLKHQREFSVNVYYKVLSYCIEMQKEFEIERNDFMNV